MSRRRSPAVCSATPLQRPRSRQLDRPGEFELIARYFAPIAGPGGLGLLDDAGVIRPGRGYEVVVTADALVAGVHFFPDDPPASIARKALAVNLSDLAAKGAKPEGFVLGLALPRGWTEDFLADFAAGLAEEARRGGCPLIGGDTVATPGPLTLSITAFGTVPAGRMVRRAGGRPGDLVCVSGTIGDGALGLFAHGAAKPEWVDALAADARAHLADRYLHPQARLALAPFLQAKASAAMDVSDGLVGDLSKLARASGTGARIDLAGVPLSPAARSAIMADAALTQVALTGGDDYEILFTLPPGERPSLDAAAAETGIPLTVIGEVTGGDVVFVGEDGAAVSFAEASFAHF